MHHRIQHSPHQRRVRPVPKGSVAAFLTARPRSRSRSPHGQIKTHPYDSEEHQLGAGTSHHGEKQHDSEEHQLGACVTSLHGEKQHDPELHGQGEAEHELRQEQEQSSGSTGRIPIDRLVVWPIDILQRVQDIYDIAHREVSGVLDRLAKGEHYDLPDEVQMRMHDGLEKSCTAVCELSDWLEKHVHMHACASTN